MNQEEKVIEKFYKSFQNKDYKGMQDCYHDDIHFSDPVFTSLDGKKAKAMWHMLVTTGKDLELTYSNIIAEEAKGKCNWEAKYTFSVTGKKVHNIIQANFEFKDGKIIRHKDVFDLWRWAGMALGPVGKIIGWTPMIQNKVRKTASGNLEKFIKKNPEYE